ncbi:MAG: hypothetical protein K2X90_02315 [Candidatus Babeliaceae bacterium]|nr:hypothetical protein [Candidatus Babeliaceae bacterium]
MKKINIIYVTIFSLSCWLPANRIISSDDPQIISEMNVYRELLNGRRTSLENMARINGLILTPDIPQLSLLNPELLSILPQAEAQQRIREAWQIAQEFNQVLWQWETRIGGVIFSRSLDDAAEWREY